MDLKIEKMLLGEIVLDKNNPKEHPKNQINKIKTSITEYGFNDPIAVDENNMIIEGNGRFLAALQLDIKEIPVIRLTHLSELQKKQYILAHNKLTLDTGFDEELLRMEFERIIELGGTLELTGFEAHEIELLKIETEDILEEKEIPLLKDNTFSKKGDLWILGKHKLLVGDATDEDDYKKLLDNDKVDLVITDPPYNINYEGANSSLKIKNDNLSNEEFYNFLLKSFQNMHKNLNEGSMIYVFYSDKESVNFRNAFNNAGLYNSQTCIWAKNQFVLGRQDFHCQHEPILVGWKEGVAHKFYGDRKQGSIWEFNKPLRNDSHPTMKPIEMLEYIIKNSSKRNNLILDPFGGSGSTLIAAELTKRKAALLELDEKYADVIVKRYENLNKEDITLIRDGKEYSYSEILEMR